MTGGNLRWHSCSTHDFPLKRHKVSKACEACRAKKMRCDGKNPCQRCDSNKIKCTYNDKPSHRLKKLSIKKEKKMTVPSESNSSAEEEEEDEDLLLSPLPTTHVNFKKISLVNELYETIRLQSRRQRYGTCFLFDFFNTTSQPQTIWTYFIVCFNRFCDNTTDDQISNELVKEAFRVFVTHNLLYGAFISTDLLLFVLESLTMFKFMQQKATDNAYYTVLIYAILAITFQSAHQSLPNMNESFTNSLCYYSHLFYTEAHEKFLKLVFPTAIEKRSRKQFVYLIQASLLLSHFQCSAIDSQQAYMTLKMGIQFAQQLDNEQDDDQDSLFALIMSLDAWNVWLSFYLDKPYFHQELTVPPSNFVKKNKEQNWAFQVADQYTLFLKNLLLLKCSDSSSTINTLKDCFEALSKIQLSSKDEFIPGHIISLYHDMVLIQLYQQQDDTSEQVIETSLHMLDTVNKVIFMEYNKTSPLKYAPHSIIYSICFLSTINLARRERKDDFHLQLMKLLKIASVYFEDFQLLYQKLMTASTVSSPSPSSLSTSSSASSNTTMMILPNTDFMNLPTNIVMSRADIDKEQLDKLSHTNKQLQLQQQLLLNQQLNNQVYLPNYPIDNNNKRQYQDFYQLGGYVPSPKKQKFNIDLESTVHHDLMYNIMMLEDQAKLPLPQPKAAFKNWANAIAPTHTKLFFDSEVQTLHYQTPSSLLNFDAHRPSIDSSVTTSDSMEAAAAAWAVAIDKRQGHWINSEKVDDDYWDPQ